LTCFNCATMMKLMMTSRNLECAYFQKFQIIAGQGLRQTTRIELGGYAREREV